MGLLSLILKLFDCDFEDLEVCGCLMARLSFEYSSFSWWTFADNLNFVVASPWIGALAFSYAKDWLDK